MPDDRQPIFHIVLQVLAESLGPYVRRRLADEYPDRSWSSPALCDGVPGNVDLNDLSTQFFILTGQDRSGKSILSAEPGLHGRIHDIQIVRDRLAHGAELERSEMLTALSGIVEILRIIGDVKASDRVSQELAAYTAAGPRMETSGAEPPRRLRVFCRAFGRSPSRSSPGAGRSAREADALGQAHRAHRGRGGSGRLRPAVPGPRRDGARRGRATAPATADWD